MLKIKQQINNLKLFYLLIITNKYSLSYNKFGLYSYKYHIIRPNNLE